MPETTEWIYKQTELLPRLYDKLALSLIGGPCTHLTSYKYGYGWIDETTNPAQPVPQKPPLDTNTLPEPVYTGSFQLGDLYYSNGAVIMKCRIPSGSVSSPTKVTCLLIIDHEGDAVAAASFLPEWIEPDGDYMNTCTFAFPVVVGE